MCVICQALQVLDVAVQRFGLSIAGSVAVVRQQPAERHIMILIAVDHGTCGELVVVLFAVQRFFDTAVVFLAFLVAFAVFKKDTFFVFHPVVAVVGIQMSLVETELRQQHRVTGQLVEIVQQGDSAVVNHIEGIQIVRVV